MQPRRWKTAWMAACLLGLLSLLSLSASAVVAAPAGSMAGGGQGPDGTTSAMPAQNATAIPCSPEWVALIDGIISTGDRQGHGPDPGSEEWKSVVEFRLGLRDRAGAPARDDPAWCGLVDRLVHGVPAASPDGPSFPCMGVRPGSAEAMVCGDAELAALDRALAHVYAAALARSANEYPPFFKAEQRGWAKGRDECWKSPDRRACVHGAYVLRIAELQARYGLVAQEGPRRYVCGASPVDEVVVTCFATIPPTLIAERGDQVSLMYRQDDGPAPVDAASVTYRGRNEWLRLAAGPGDSGGLCVSGASGGNGGTGMPGHGGEAVLVWGHQAPELRCRPAD